MIDFPFEQIQFYYTKWPSTLQDKVSFDQPKYLHGLELLMQQDPWTRTLEGLAYEQKGRFLIDAYCITSFEKWKTVSHRGVLAIPSQIVSQHVKESSWNIWGEHKFKETRKIEEKKKWNFFELFLHLFFSSPFHLAFFSLFLRKLFAFSFVSLRVKILRGYEFVMTR